MKGSGPESVPVPLTVSRIRVWPVFIKGDVFPAGYVAEAQIDQTGGYRFGADAKKEDAIGELHTVLEEEGINGRPTPDELKECPDLEPRVIHSSTWTSAPHPEDKQNRNTHARRSILTTGASVTVTGLMTAREAQSAIGAAIISNRDRLKHKVAVYLNHKYDPTPTADGDPEL